MKKTKKISEQLKSEKLNIGCGTDILEGYVNLDKFKFKGVEVIWDIDETPWPFEDNSFSEIVMNHVLEHSEDVVKTMEEIARVGKNGAIVKIEVPYFSGLNAVADPTHKHFFASKTFDFFERGNLGKGNYFEESSGINFKILNKRIIFSGNGFLKFFNFLVNLNHKIYERFFAYIFPSQVLKVTLRNMK